MDLLNNLRLNIKGKKFAYLKNKKRKITEIEQDENYVSNRHQAYDDGNESEDSLIDDRLSRKNTEDSSTLIVTQPNNYFTTMNELSEMNNELSNLTDITPQKEIWRKCGLEEDELEAQKYEEEYQREDIGGPYYKCELCKRGTDDPTVISLSSTLRNIYIYEKKNAMFTSEDYIFEKYAELYNMYIYNKAVKIGNPAKLKPITKAIVRYHRKRCAIKSHKSPLQDQCTFQERALTFMQKKEMFEIKEDDNGEVIPESRRMTKVGLNNYLKLLREYRETVKVVNAIQIKEEQTISSIPNNPNSSSMKFPIY